MAEGAIELRPGETRIIIANYRDPDNPSQKVAGFVDSDTCVAVEDVTWTGSYTGDSDGDLIIDVDAGGNSAKLTLSNTGAAPGVLSKLKLNGRMVSVYDPQISEALDSDSVALYDERPMTISLKYQNSINFAQNLVDVTLSERKDGRLVVKTVKFTANLNATLMEAAMRGEPGRRIAITSQQADKSAEEYFIDGVQFNIREGRIIDVTWWVSLADANSYFILDTSVLDGTDVLAL
jgi:hypothetical protein